MSNCFCQCRYVNIRLLSPLRRKNHGVFRGDNCVTYDDLNKDNSRMFDILNYINQILVVSVANITKKIDQELKP